METKLFEVRDRGTFIPVICVKLEPGNEPDRYLLAMTGFGLRPETQAKYVLYGVLNTGKFIYTADGHDYSARTSPIAHNHIQKHWEELNSGDVIDVEFILGESKRPKESQRIEKKL